MKYLYLIQSTIIIFVFIIIHSNKTTAKERSSDLRNVQFTYETVIKDIPKDASTVYLWLPLPSSDKNQQITNLRINSVFPYKETKEDTYGNRLLFIDASDRIDNEVHVKVMFDVTRKEHRSSGLSSDVSNMSERVLDLDTDQFMRFLQPDRLAVIDDEVKSLAATITEGQKGLIKKIRAIYDYLIQKMEYNKEAMGWGRGDTKRALRVCKGNCCDYHSTFTSLTRAVGIPSRFEYGFALPEASEGPAIAHCWAEFYDPQYGWIPVDVSEADKHQELREYYFGNHDANRVLFTIGRDIILNPSQKGEPLNFLINPYVEIDGYGYNEIKFFAKYRDI